MVYLFSYGSNGKAQLTERLGHAVSPKAAFVEGFWRVFRGHSERWGGGVASLERKAGKTTYGNAVKVTDADLRTLDRFEGVAGGKYKRQKVKVFVREGEEFVEHEGVAYVSTSDRYEEPSQAYLEAIAKNVAGFWSDTGEITWRSFPLR